MVTCTSCGATINPPASFCSKCGTAQPANAGAPSSLAATGYAPTPAVPKKKSKVLKILGIVFGIFIALVVWGAIIDAGKNGGKAPATSEANSDSKPANAAIPDRGGQEDKEGRLMCAETELQIKEFLKGTLQGIECKPAGVPGGIALVVAYPAPLLANDNVVRKNTLFTTFSIAGGAISRHPNTSVKTVYVLDSSETVFTVPGEFAEQLYTKMVNNQLSQADAREQVVKVAQRGKVPESGH